MIPAYSKIYALGHKAVSEIFNEPVHVQEKVDGSQLSFGVYRDQLGHKTLEVRSRGGSINIEEPQKLFQPAVAWIKANEPKLKEGYTYRAEALCSKKHNVLNYGRRPEAGFVLYDVDKGLCDYMGREELEGEAYALGVECVPTFWFGKVSKLEDLNGFMENESFLGGCKIEGYVVKNYQRFGVDKKVLMAKYVSEAFKEIHRKDPQWQPKGEFINDLIQTYATEARWNKAVQHLREDDKLAEEPRDIGTIVREVNLDVLAECKDQIKEELFGHFWGRISKGITRGVAQWYKDELAKKQFGE